MHVEWVKILQHAPDSPEVNPTEAVPFIFVKINEHYKM